MKLLRDWFHRYNAWSFSKHRLYGLCKRAYYYRYIAPALVEPGKLNVPKIKMLKNLTSKYALQGKLIHEVLENQMGQHFIGRNTDIDIAKKQYEQSLRRYRKTAARTVTEFFYGAGVEKSFFDAAETDGEEKLDMFFNVIWPQLKDMEYLKHEDFDRFSVGDVRCIVKADYVSRTPEGLLIVTDWKTGADKEEYESDLQLGAYVLWASEYYGERAEDIRSEAVYLTTGVMHPYEFTEETLDGVREQIVDDFEKMNDSYGMGYFPADPQPRKCLSCEFSTVCDDSKAGEGLNEK